MNDHHPGDSDAVQLEHLVDYCWPAREVDEALRLTLSDECDSAGLTSGQDHCLPEASLVRHAWRVRSARGAHIYRDRRPLKH